MPKIILDIEKCVSWDVGGIKCPYNETKDTPGAGCASDYYCTAVTPKKKTSGYVEWSKEINPVPTWCPLRIDKVEIQKSENEKIVGANI